MDVSSARPPIQAYAQGNEDRDPRSHRERGCDHRGVFMTAANGWTGTRGIAGFQDFSVT
ncbi:hypothetical protein [Streptomyces sp. 5-10]|uniref:hypothetical protein n=1 Tax=Streptomyces sp. 5-10 TaxID=878925 RepID=UPI00168C083F|nr:hypothetical protein [Streptomyces sp. 5-10]MBD3005380.1 hypothetical protein [Streptomyces sp. 5-10]